MGYPYDKTYLEQIQERPKECELIREAFYILRLKYLRDRGQNIDTDELSIKENFALLGEAFELASDVVDGITDAHHFMWDVLDALLPERSEE